MPSVSTLQHSYLKQLWYDFPPFSFPFRNHTEKEATQKKTHTRTLLSMPALPSCRCTHHFGTLFGSCSGEAGRRRSGRHSPGSSLTQQVVSKLSTALLKAEVPLVQEKWAT